MKPQEKKESRGKKAPVTLKSVAECVGLTASTVSAVLNNSSASHSVPERTKSRILAAARDLNYRPNFFARSLRVKRTYTIGVLLAEMGDAYGSVVISGMERYLREQNFFFLTVTHRHDNKLLATYSTMLVERGVEGFITVDTSLTEQLTLPTVAVAGHRRAVRVDRAAAKQCSSEREAGEWSNTFHWKDQCEDFMSVRQLLSLTVAPALYVFVRISFSCHDAGQRRTRQRQTVNGLFHPAQRCISRQPVFPDCKFL